ncbi:MAG: WbqC-like protein family protein [uncultured bacterium]|nr:MAG: WbqC-like protein family protein [uncultured bacterium]
MKIAIHQPEFLPWTGFFHKMYISDLYVVLDHVQFKKRYFENRNRIISPNGEISYVGIPVITKGKFNQNICDVEIDSTQTRWREKILNKISHYYRRAVYFEMYFDELASIIKHEYKYLIEFNMELIQFFRKHFEINCSMIKSSALPVRDYKSSELILQLCSINKADVYLCGNSGQDYLQTEEFNKHKIKIEWLNYQPIIYKQQCETFVPNLSSLDLLLNHGKDSFKFIMNANKEKGGIACTF